MPENVVGGRPMIDATRPQLQLHLEPNNPIEVADLTAALNSLARQYRLFAQDAELLEGGGEARLLVTSLRPGSIDIGLIPEIMTAGGAYFAASAAGLAPVVDHLGTVTKFGQHIRALIDLFKGGPKSPATAGDSDDDIPEKVSVRDCDDAINIVRPIAESGGTQTFHIYTGQTFQQIVRLDAVEARQITQRAVRQKSKLQAVSPEQHQRVAMVWKRLDRDKARSKGASPDKALISEIDPKSRSVFFTDELSYLKQEMIQDEENPYKKVYFVDVEVSRVEGKIASYRVVGYHGKDALDDGDSDATVEL